MVFAFLLPSVCIWDRFTSWELHRPNETDLDSSCHIGIRIKSPSTQVVNVSHLACQWHKHTHLRAQNRAFKYCCCSWCIFGVCMCIKCSTWAESVFFFPIKVSLRRFTLCFPLPVQSSSVAPALKNNISADSRRFKEMTYCTEDPPIDMNVPAEPTVQITTLLSEP